MANARFQTNARVIRAGVDNGDCSVRVDARGLVIDRDVIPLRKLVGAVTELTGPDETCRVSVVIRESWELFSTVSIEVDGRERGSELAKCLRLAPDQDVLSASIGHQTTTRDIAALISFLATGMLGPFALVGHVPETIAYAVGTPFVAGSLPAAFLAFEFLFRIRVTVGLDGVTRRTWRKREHFAFGAIDGVERTARGPSLILKNKTRIQLFEFMNSNQNATVGELLYRRIWQGHFAHSELCKKQSTIDDVHVLGARSWVRTLRENSSERATSYRAAARTLPQLEQAVTDVTQPLQVRVAAAIALRAKEGTTAETRIRAAASTSASPKLRVLFERIAEEASDEELAEHIEGIAIE